MSISPEPGATADLLFPGAREQIEAELPGAEMKLEQAKRQAQARMAAGAAKTGTKEELPGMLENDQEFLEIDGVRLRKNMLFA